MKATFDVQADLPKRIVFVRMQGLFDESDMRSWAITYRVDGTDRFRGKKHLVIADMRGMKATRPIVAEVMGTEIGYARQHGVVLCAHLSDDTVQRLQANRLARKNAAADDVTVDVVSMEEAQAVVREARSRIDDGTPLASVRLAHYFETGKSRIRGAPAPRAR